MDGSGLPSGKSILFESTAIHLLYSFGLIILEFQRCRNSAYYPEVSDSLLILTHPHPRPSSPAESQAESQGGAPLAAGACRETLAIVLPRDLLEDRVVYHLGDA
jgi:hypothetical protein